MLENNPTLRVRKSREVKRSGKENIGTIFAERRHISGNSKERLSPLEDYNSARLNSDKPTDGSFTNGLNPISCNSSSITIHAATGADGFDGQELQRKPSVRQRMLSKVRGGLSVRSKSNLNMRPEPCSESPNQEAGQGQEQEHKVRSTSSGSGDTSIEKLEKILRSASLSR